MRLERHVDEFRLPDREFQPARSSGHRHYIAMCMCATVDVGMAISVVRSQATPHDSTSLTPGRVPPLAVMASPY